MKPDSRIHLAGLAAGASDGHSVFTESIVNKVVLAILLDHDVNTTTFAPDFLPDIRLAPSFVCCMCTGKFNEVLCGKLQKNLLQA